MLICCEYKIDRFTEYKVMTKNVVATSVPFSSVLFDMNVVYDWMLV